MLAPSQGHPYQLGHQGCTQTALPTHWIRTCMDIDCTFCIGIVNVLLLLVYLLTDWHTICVLDIITTMTTIAYVYDIHDMFHMIRPFLVRHA